MILQHAALEITQIPTELFRDISQFIQDYLGSPCHSAESCCALVSYSPDMLRRWARFTEYREDTFQIRNTCTVFAHPMVFNPWLRTLILELTEAFSRINFQGQYSLFHSNWGYSCYPFHVQDGILIWDEETLARQQPNIRKFWNAMVKSGYSTIPDLMTAMYTSMTDRQLYDAFGILDAIFYDPEQEIQPVDAYYFDNDGIPELESMVDFTYNCFLSHGWQDYGDIWGFFRYLKEQFARKQIPFGFPDIFLSALNSQE